MTVTDGSASRFFMTIPEAVSLVLTAGGVGRDQELYVLDMGEPIRIRDFAEQMIRFYGYEPDRDIEISEIGLRPGEKLTESLFDTGERAIDSPSERIFRVERPAMDRDRLDELIATIRPICFFDQNRPAEYRNRRILRKLLGEEFPSLVRDPNEPEY